MKKLLLSTFFVLNLLPVFAQVGIGTTTPDQSSILDLSASNKGFIAPRINLTSATNASLDGINTNANGLMIYNTNASLTGGNGVGYYFWDGSSWIAMKAAAAGTNWSLAGNSVTATDFLGTTNAQPLNFRVNTVEVAKFSTSGGIGLGTGSVATAANAMAVGFNAIALEDGVALGYGATNTNIESIAIGKNASSTFRNLAIGFEAKTAANNTIAIGTSAEVANDNTIGIGYLAKPTGNNSIGIGTSTITSGNQSTAIGNVAVSQGQEAIAIGQAATAQNLRSIAIGADTDAIALSSIALGDGAQATANNALALGFTSRATQLNSIAIGANSISQQPNGIAIGNSARSADESAIALGNGANASAQYSVVIGSATRAGSFGVSIGNDAGKNAVGPRSVAIGNNSSSGTRSVSVGQNAATAANDAVAIGNNSNATADNSSALGSGSSATAINATAIGANAVASQANSVILGSNADVGIGTNTPTAKLQVNGTLRYVDATPGDDNGKVLTSDANGNASWQSISGIPQIVAAGLVIPTGGASATFTTPKLFGATLSRTSKGNYQVTFTSARTSANYIINLANADCNGNCDGSNFDDPAIAYRNRTTTGFLINVGDNDNGSTNRSDRDLEFSFSVIDF